LRRVTLARERGSTSHGKGAPTVMGTKAPPRGASELAGQPGARQGARLVSCIFWSTGALAAKRDVRVTCYTIYRAVCCYAPGGAANLRAVGPPWAPVLWRADPLQHAALSSV